VAPTTYPARVEARQPRWRWERAKSDTTFLLGWRRNLIDLLVTGVPVSVALQFLGSKGAGIDELIALGVSLLVVFVVRPLVGLGWNYLQAPMRMLTDDVHALAARLEPMAPALTRHGVRLRVLEFVRAGVDLSGYYPVHQANVDRWSREVSEFLREYESVIDTAGVERFLAANDRSSPAATLRLRNAALQEIADSLKDR
jgi:hypothetical protein